MFCGCLRRPRELWGGVHKHPTPQPYGDFSPSPEGDGEGESPYIVW